MFYIVQILFRFFFQKQEHGEEDTGEAHQVHEEEVGVEPDNHDDCGGHRFQTGNQAGFYRPDLCHTPEEHGEGKHCTKEYDTSEGKPETDVCRPGCFPGSGDNGKNNAAHNHAVAGNTHASKFFYQLLRQHVIGYHGNRCKESPEQTSRCNYHGMDIPVGSQQEGPCHGQKDSRYFFAGRQTVYHGTGESHDHDRTGVLEDGGRAAVGPEDGLLVAELTQHDAEDGEDDQLNDIAAVFPDGGHVVSTFDFSHRKTCQNHDGSCAEHTEGCKVCSIDCEIFKYILAAASGKAPEDGCDDGDQCAVFAVFRIHL